MKKSLAIAAVLLIGVHAVKPDLGYRAWSGFRGWFSHAISGAVQVNKRNRTTQETVESVRP